MSERKEKQEDDYVNKVCTVTWETRKAACSSCCNEQSCGCLFLNQTALSVRTDLTCHYIY